MDGLFDLGGHVALVTGGNSGIGLGMAEGLAAHGAAVAIWGTNAAKNDATSKAGLIAMMRGIAVEHARHLVRANAVLPGWIASDMPRVPMRRWGERTDFAGIAVYLAGPASSYVTGDVITIDGGYHSF